jgi:hypothetical protein
MGFEGQKNGASRLKGQKKGAEMENIGPLFTGKAKEKG